MYLKKLNTIIKIISNLQRIMSLAYCKCNRFLFK